MRKKKPKNESGVSTRATVQEEMAKPHGKSAREEVLKRSAGRITPAKRVKAKPQSHELLFRRMQGSPGFACVKAAALKNRFRSLRKSIARETELGWRGKKMPDEDWMKTLEDGRKVKFIYQELLEDGAFITAQLAGNEIVYSVELTKARNPLSCAEVESHFECELSKK